jgi:hypothetical protein
MTASFETDHTPLTPGLRLIIAYKLLKAPVMLSLAVWLTVSPQGAFELVESFAEELSASSALWSRLGDWIQANLSLRLVKGGAALVWLDAISTVIEAVLLLLRKPWAEWMVTLGLALLIPLELVSLERRPSVSKALVLLVNAAVVVYLAQRRIKAARASIAGADGKGGHDIAQGQDPVQRSVHGNRDPRSAGHEIRADQSGAPAKRLL